MDTSVSYNTEVTAFTLISDDTMLISVSVDELDINSVSKNQEAEVSLDAIEDQTFTGAVTEVSNTADNTSGGVAKYSVSITIPKDQAMKAGMNASATIVVEERENVVTIPVNALQERGDKVFVYTKKDGDGNLSGEQEVTTGLSDGNKVEITEGLSDGTTVYYQKTGSLSQDSFGEMPSEMSRGQNMDGEMPFGEMPSGGSPGQGGGMQ